MSGYLHGVETIEIQVGPQPVRVVKSSVIALFGIAPKGPVDEMTLVLGPRDAAQFGEELPGFNIPQSLDAIFKQGPATVLVVNSLDAASNLEAVASENQTVVNAAVRTEFPPIANLVVQNQAEDTTYDLNTDYTFDDFGNIKIISFDNISEGDILSISYSKLNAATVTAAQLIGQYDPADDSYTGMQCFDLAAQTLGFSPKIIIGPGFSQLTGIASEMAVKASKYRGVYCVDAPEGTTFQNAIAGRGPAGSINWFTSNPRAILCYPMLKKFDPYTGDTVNWWYSAFWAGVKSSVDLNASKGYWWSPSNQEIKGAEGVEVEITASLSDPQTQANLLNEVGVVTVFQAFGTGLRTWGNRSAAWPASSAIENFIPVRVTADVIEESIEQATLPYMDRPINKALIDSVRLNINAFLRSLIQRGAVLDGECIYDQEENTPVKLAAGHVTFTYDFIPPPPMERVTYKAQLNINLLSAVVS